MWAPIGEQVEVPIIGRHRDKRILTGVLNIQTGTYFQYFSETYTQETFQTILGHIRRFWRSWHIVLFLRSALSAVGRQEPAVDQRTRDRTPLATHGLL
jgi:hypothetical protein